MKASETLKTKLQLSDNEMREFIKLIHFHAADIKFANDHTHKMRDAIAVMQTGFLFTMDERFSEPPIPANELDRLVEELFIELGYEPVTKHQKLFTASTLKSSP